MSRPAGRATGRWPSMPTVPIPATGERDQPGHSRHDDLPGGQRITIRDCLRGVPAGSLKEPLVTDWTSVRGRFLVRECSRRMGVPGYPPGRALPQGPTDSVPTSRICDGREPAHPSLRRWPARSPTWDSPDPSAPRPSRPAPVSGSPSISRPDPTASRASSRTPATGVHTPATAWTTSSACPCNGPDSPTVDRRRPPPPCRSPEVIGRRQ